MCVGLSKKVKNDRSSFMGGGGRPWKLVGGEGGGGSNSDKNALVCGVLVCKKLGRIVVRWDPSAMFREQACQSFAVEGRLDCLLVFTLFEVPAFLRGNQIYVQNTRMPVNLHPGTPSMLFSHKRKVDHTNVGLHVQILLKTTGKNSILFKN